MLFVNNVYNIFFQCGEATKLFFVAGLFYKLLRKTHFFLIINNFMQKAYTDLRAETKIRVRINFSQVQ